MYPSLTPIVLLQINHFMLGYMHFFVGIVLDLDIVVVVYNQR